jgi:hypothetical protein
MQEIERLRRQLARKASAMIVGGFRPSDDPFASWFGRVQVALPHDAWPMYRNRPMTPLCQIALSVWLMSPSSPSSSTWTSSLSPTLSIQLTSIQ